MDCNSDINDNDNEEFSWESDDDEKENRAGMPGEACEAGPSQPSLYSHFIAMGFSKNMVEKAIKENGEGNSEAVLETLLTYSAIENPYLENEAGPIESSIASNVDGLDDDSSDTDNFDDQCQFFLVHHTSLKSQKRNLVMWKILSYMKTLPR